MKKFIKFIVISILSITYLLWGLSLWYQVDTPAGAANDDIKISGTVNIDKQKFKTTYLKITNKYVWIVAWVVCMGIVIYAGILLISSEWDDQQLTKANKTLIYWLVWIVISLWAYVILNVILDLF